MPLELRVPPDHQPRALALPRVRTRPTHQPMLDLDGPRLLPRQRGTPTDEPTQLARGIGHAIVEVLAGRRPAGQLERWASPEVIADLRLATRHQQSRPLRLGSLRIQHPSERTIEVGMRVEHAGVRSSAVAFQLTGRGERWWCSAIELGPELSPGVRGTS